ncbi:MAG: phytanoyl-CoA dioxygenase family protein [Paludisphaera borealis]|uniref:phytanoyl-CoA dioxygenase family protein n=1 Tax=Paludisphaera borealis TaxID=1387353 RepID=UPI00284751D9|nr:phytanoyl-CoA dioxygenase family protein [Paludisphaera borealis]MDR3619649.1 phytanoyl-CoA dioxygenase family protein [Paludisphaera borealis]
MDGLDTLDQNGFAIVADVLSGGEADELVEALGAVRPGSRLERAGEVYASRNLLADIPEVRRIAEGSRLSGLVQSVLGPGAFVVRGLLFDKTPTANWGVPWHQDLTIAIKRRVDAPGFGPWTVKGGVPHVRPPIDVLERMVTIRLQLDDAGLEDGPLLVVPGSHRQGRLDVAASQEWLDKQTVQTCLVPRGGALMMRPLLLHASSPSNGAAHRRVVHLEYATGPLPFGVEWYEQPPAASLDFERLHA